MLSFESSAEALAIGQFGFPPSELFQSVVQSLQPLGFRHVGRVTRGALFESSERVALVIDHRIWDNQFPFPYAAYSDEQNQLMAQYPKLYRTMVDDPEDVPELLQLIKVLAEKTYETEDGFGSGATNRELTSIDPTMPEAYFEQAFIEVFGREQLDSLAREYPIVDIQGSPRAVDYYIERACGNIAIEKNGVSYHHPQILGKERYAKQLVKQNSLVAYGCKLYRWSLESMQFVERFKDELRHYLGTPDAFLSARKLGVTRSFRLHQHQDSALETLAVSRSLGEKAALVVLPTGTGKTEVLIADYAGCCSHSSVKSKADNQAEN